MLQAGLGLAQGLQVTTTGAEAAFGGLFEAHAGFQMLAQQVQAGSRLGRQGDGYVAVVAGFQGNGFARQIGFVANQGDPRRIRFAVEKLRPQGERIGGFRRRGVHHQQHPVGLTDGLERALHADALNLVVGIAQAGGVDHVQRHAIDVDMFAQHIAGGAGDIGDDGRLTPGQGIEQAGLAGVGTAGDDHVHAVTQQRALTGFAQHCG